MTRKFKSKQEKQTYQSWADMRSRCNNPKHKRYFQYGEIGIGVCERWDDFEMFVADMGGLKPTGKSLGRKDKRKGYAPNNCAWMSYSDNNRNFKDMTRVTHKGRTQSIEKWADEVGISRSTLSERIHRYQWPVDVALSADPQELVVNLPDDPRKLKFVPKSRQLRKLRK